MSACMKEKEILFHNIEKVNILPEPIPIQGLFEVHLTVSDLQRSIDFYRDIVGLQPAFG